MSDKSDTPRTDAVLAAWARSGEGGTGLMTDHARQLERELAEAMAECERLRNENSLMAAHQGIDNYQRVIGRAEKAEAECERLRPDAERYRKCRRNDGFYFSSDRMTDDEIDARIDGMDDAARKP